jgi:hypothetical protein
MSEANAPLSLTTWGTDLQPAACPRCHAAYLVACDAHAARCPSCCQSMLEVLSDDIPYLTHAYPPELVTPFALSEAQISEAIRQFAAGIPFAPSELSDPAFRSRLATVYLPMWLVDGRVLAYWQAEAGFDYQVISHQEYYEQNRNGWESREVKEPRVRWETRVGRLNRTYQNVAAPALDNSSSLEKKLGHFALDSALSYTPNHIQHAFVRLPDIPPKVAWAETASAFQKTAAEECQKASGANRIRQFRWKARFARLNWTLMLLPTYSTCYQDDHGEVQPVLIHGQTGTVSGARRASMRRARGASLIILAIGVLLLIAGLLLNLGSAADLAVNTISAYCVVLGITTMIASGAPVMIAWDFNRRQKLEEAEVRAAAG